MSIPAPENSTIEIRPVVTKADQLVFLRVPFTVFADDKNWVPQLFVERLEHLDPKKNPFFDHAEAAFWTAFQNGDPVGRISAQICSIHQQHYPEKIGQFGFLDAIDDEAIFDELLKTAADWLSQRGQKHMQGPFSLSINDEVGLLIDGFDTPPSLMMGHALPYYADHLERLGFAKAKDVLAYDYDLVTGDFSRAAPLIERIKKTSSLSVRTINKKNLNHDLAIIIDIFKEAWSDNWGYVPMTKPEIEALGKNLKMLVREGYVTIASLDGEPQAMAVTLPNLNDAITDLNGKILPLGWLKIIWRIIIRPPKSVRLLLMGVRKKHQNTTKGAALAFIMINELRQYHHGRGTQRCEMSWVLEDNTPMRHMLEAMGANPYKTYRIYERAL